MIKQRPLQISLKQLHTQYKQIKKLHIHQQYEVLIFRSIINKKKVLCVKKFEDEESQVTQFIKKLYTYATLKSENYINGFLAYAISKQQSKISAFRFQVFALFGFGELTLDTFIRKRSKNYQRSYSIEFVQYLCKQSLKALISIESAPSTQALHLALSHQLICVNNYGEISQSLKFCYLPFPFLRQGAIKNIDLKNEIYSSAQLRQINKNNKQSQQILAQIARSDIILQSQRQTEHPLCIQQIIQKIGLTLLKCAYYLCQDVSVGEISFQMYTMNQKFQIDYNWDLIHAFLKECSKHKDYARLAKIIYFMLKDISEDKTFEYCLQVVNQILETPSIKQQGAFKKGHFFSFQDDSQVLDQDQSKGDKQIKKPKYQTIEEVKDLFAERIIHEINNLDGTFYRGQILDNQKHGLGIYYFLQGEVFGGEWREDQMYGDGVYIFSNGQRYAGSIKSEVKQGYGKYMYSNGNIYIGEWKNDLKQGYGQLLTAQTGQRYQGNFKKNMKEGKGSIYYPSYEVFQGQFVGGFKHGIGKLYDKNGRIEMKAKWNQDQIEGDAQIYYENSDYYVGQLKKGKKHGKGTYRFFDGTIYQGEFQNDNLTGHCSIYFNNGDTYNGEILEGKFTGTGKYLFKQQGVSYSGDWKGGLQNGRGRYEYKTQLRISTTQQSRQLVVFSVEKIQN